MFAAPMRKVISISEIVEAREVEQGTEEVCALAEADYAEEKSRLVVQLDCFLRVSDRRGHEQCIAQDWLPKAQTVEESVPPEEAVPAAKEIFQR